MQKEHRRYSKSGHRQGAIGVLSTRSLSHPGTQHRRNRAPENVQKEAYAEAPVGSRGKKSRRRGHQWVGVVEENQSMWQGGRCRTVSVSTLNRSPPFQFLRNGCAVYTPSANAYIGIFQPACCVEIQCPNSRRPCCYGAYSLIPNWCLITLIRSTTSSASI